MFDFSLGSKTFLVFSSSNEHIIQHGVSKGSLGRQRISEAASTISSSGFICPARGAARRLFLSFPSSRPRIAEVAFLCFCFWSTYTPAF